MRDQLIIRAAQDLPEGIDGLVGLGRSEAFGAGFRRLRLRTHSGDADAFYRAVGFTRTVDEACCTHEMRLTTR